MVGDLADLATVRAAMEGAPGVFVVLTAVVDHRVSAAAVEAEERTGKALADLAKSIGVGHFVYSSVGGANLPSGVAHVENKGRIEQHIRRIGLAATVLRPVFFMDNFATHSRPTVVDGELVVSLGLLPSTRLPLIAVHDIGAFAALAFESPDEYVGRDITIAGDELTGPQIADAFRAATGMPARFQQIPNEYVRAFDPEVAKMFDWFNNRDVAAADLAQLRERHPQLMNLETWVRTSGWEPAITSPAAFARA